MEFLGFLGLILLVGWSIALWQIIRAVVYRLTKDDEKYWLVWIAYAILMLATAVGFAATHEALFAKAGDEADAWFTSATNYCVAAIVVTFGVLAFRGLRWTLQGLVEAIRGE